MKTSLVINDCYSYSLRHDGYVLVPQVDPKLVVLVE